MDEVTMLVAPADGPADLLRQVATLCEGYENDDEDKARDQLTSVLERLQQ